MKSAALARCFFVATVLAALSGPSLLAQREKLPPDDLEIVEKRWPNAKKTFTGLRYVVVEPGDRKGPMPEAGMKAKVLYKGMLLNGTVFDESSDAQHPLVSRVARGDLIQGWDEALQLMHKGEKWILIVPSEMAYGARGRPPQIPRDATLVFEMTLVDFGKELK